MTERRTPDPAGGRDAGRDPEEQTVRGSTADPEDGWAEEPVDRPAVPRGFEPLREYAAIGDCHGAALVSRSGSVDWCTLGRFDADPVFCRLLDRRKGGFLSVRPVGRFDVRRRYLEGTNILRTVFHASGGRVAVTDFMPVGRRERSGVHDYVTLGCPFWLVRIVEGLEGCVRLRIAFRPTVDFGRRRPEVRTAPRRVQVRHGPVLAGDVEWLERDGLFTADVDVEAGRRLRLVVSAAPVPEEGLDERLDRSLEITRAFWDEWSDYCRYEGRYREAVERSALVLKLLTYAPSGAIVAAPTTSLPEEIGGVRNWDYRFCWLRDSAFTLYSLAFLGYGGEAEDFSTFLMRACAGRPDIQVLYGVGGETEVPETILDHLEGYRLSTPVRIGNAAAKQRQIDIYGEVLDWAHLYRELGGRFSEAGEAFLRRLAEFVVEHWEEPGEGIWEVRTGPRHFVYGKIMSWVALDRAIRLLGEEPRWVETRERIRRQVLDRGVDPDGGFLRQAYEFEGPDAACLLATMVGFPVDRGTFARTVEAVNERLREGDHVHRYLTPDGLPGREGAFLICSFWLVDALLSLDRGEEARELFDRLLERSNDLGLYAEEIDPRSGEFLGNFPQAFTHLALIQAAANLELHEARGSEALCCSHAERARHSVEATHGLRALWAAFKRSGRVGRILSSKASIMPKEWMAESSPEDWRMAAFGWPLAPRTVLSPFARPASARRAAGAEAGEPEGPERPAGAEEEREDGFLPGRPPL